MRLGRVGTLVAAALLAVVMSGSHARAAVDAQHPVSPEGADALRNGLLTLDLIKSSNLEPWWKANAMALAARTLARTGNYEAVRTMSRDAIAMSQSQVKGATAPIAFSAGPLYAILAEAFGDMRDAQSTRGLVNLSSEELGKLDDPGTRANVYPYLASLAVDLGDPEGARKMLAIASSDVKSAPPGRERISALAMIATAEAKLGDQTAASASIEAARGLMAQLQSASDRAIAGAAIGRAEIANRNAPGGRSMARQAASDYDAGTLEQNRSILEAVRTLGLISLAQAESGDKQAARTTYRAMRHTAEAMANPYERMVAWFSLADTIFQVER